MKNQPTTFKWGALPRLFRVKFITGLLPVLLLLLSVQSSFAGSANWLASPASGDWDTAGNWTVGGPPNGSADTATFASSNQTGVSLSLNTEVNGNVFNAGASAFTITASPTFTLTISGVGITNNSGIMQNFVAPVDGVGNFGTISFTNSATAGSLTAFTVYGGDGEGALGSIMQFVDTSTAGGGTFTVYGGTNGTLAENSGGGLVEFLDSSTAGNGIFTANGAENFNFPGGVDFFGTSTAGSGTFTVAGGTTDFGGGAGMNFYDSSSAGNGTFTISVAGGSYGGALITFDDSSTPGNGIFTVNGSDVPTVIGNAIYFFNAVGAGNATVIANGGLNGGSGGTIHISSFYTGSTARIEVFGNGLGDYTSGSLNEDTNGQNVPPVTIGSIEGNGVVIISLNLIVGNNNLSTTFSGVIQDAPFGPGGSLTKTGKGKLTLSNANTYTGGTTISRGALLATNTTGSATGAGAVAANAGTLGGGGIISGAVTIGTGSGRGALLAPAFGSNNQATLTLQSSLTLQANATYTYTFKARANQTRTDLVKANGVTINGATIALKGKTQGTLTPGTVLTVISNTSANPIGGTFSNLADGAIVNVNGNNLQASYTGGAGNDLTLTVQ